MVVERRYIGKKAKRVEDHRLLIGEARYLDDIKLPGMLHAVFIRSSYAHAKILNISVDAAKKITQKNKQKIYLLNRTLQKF